MAEISPKFAFVVVKVDRVELSLWTAGDVLYDIYFHHDEISKFLHLGGHIVLPKYSTKYDIMRDLQKYRIITSSPRYQLFMQFNEKDYYDMWLSSLEWKKHSACVFNPGLPDVDFIGGIRTFKSKVHNGNVYVFVGKENDEPSMFYEKTGVLLSLGKCPGISWQKVWCEHVDKDADSSDDGPRLGKVIEVATIESLRDILTKSKNAFKADRLLRQTKLTIDDY